MIRYIHCLVLSCVNGFILISKIDDLLIFFYNWGFALICIWLFWQLKVIISLPPKLMNWYLSNSFYMPGIVLCFKVQCWAILWTFPPTAHTLGKREVLMKCNPIINPYDGWKSCLFSPSTETSKAKNIQQIILKIPQNLFCK